MVMKLFDDISRTNDKYSEYAMPKYSYLNISARPVMENVRLLLEMWFSAYPCEGKEDLGIRFRSRSDIVHYSAFYELYMYSLLRIFGYHPEIHPTVHGTNNKPDFKFIDMNGVECILEAKVAFGMSEEEMYAQKRLDQAYDALNNVKSDKFFLHISILNTPTTTIPKKEIVAAAKAFLKKQDYEECQKLYESGGLEKLPSERFTIKEWIFQLSPKPKHSPQPSNSRVIGMSSKYMAEFVDDVKMLREAVLSKAGKYGRVNLPYIVAVNVLSSGIDYEDILQALLGTQKYAYSPSEGTIEPYTELDGAWTSFSKPRYTRNSAVLINIQLKPSSVARDSPLVVHNPYAKHPCINIFPDLSNSLPSNGEMTVREGIPINEIFKLPEIWPRTVV